MGETQKNSATSQPITPPVLPSSQPTAAMQAPVSAPTPAVETPPPVAPVNGPVVAPMVIQDNQNLNPQDGKEPTPNALMPEALATKKILDAQPKVQIWLPLSSGEKIGVATEYVSINGYPYWIKKGMLVNVPKAVAELLINLYNIEIGDSAFGRSKRADRSAAMQNALNG